MADMNAPMPILPDPKHRTRFLAISLALSLLAGCGDGARPGPADAGSVPMTVHVQTLFSWCNDVAAMRGFYSDVLGLKETYFDAGPGWLTYEVGGVQLVFMRSTAPEPVESGWARQPGWRDGTVDAASTVLQFAPADFDLVVARAKAKGADSFRAEPVSPAKGARQFFLRDPMGRTIEVYCEAPTP
jgi:catechol 2,3-dioxygenase-like lactoylglutathione lyase family enzyme